MRSILIGARVLVYAALIAASVPFFWQLATGGTSMVVTGSSMQPTYERGDVLFAKKTDTPAAGFWRASEIVVVSFSASAPDQNRYVHRVHRVLPDGRAVLKGDDNVEEDVSPVTPEQVVGIPIAALHGPAATAYLFSQGPIGRLLLFSVGIACLVLIERAAHRHGRRPHQLTRRRRDQEDPYGY